MTAFFLILAALLSGLTGFVRADTVAQGAAVDASPRPTPSPKQTTAEYLFSLRDPHVDYSAAIKRLQHADAPDDAREALRRKDRRLVGVMGYALIVPGAPDRSPYGLPAGYRAIPIQGTSDYIESREQGTFQKRLTAYAETYNTALLAAQQ